MSLSVIMYDPPAQQQPNIRTVYKIQRGRKTISSTIKLTSLKINPKTADGEVPESCYFASMGGAYLSIKQVELLVGEKPVDLFLSKQAINFRNSLGSPDYQYDIVSMLTGSTNNIYQDLNEDKQGLLAPEVDSFTQSIDFKNMLDYLNNRYIIDEGLSIIITWDSSNLDWLVNGGTDSAPATSVSIDPGYLSYEVIETDNMPVQDVVNFKQTIEEAILIPAITNGAYPDPVPLDNTVQQWEQRMNSLRDKTIKRALFVSQPLGQNADITNELNTFGRYASMGMNNEFLNIVIDGSQRLTFKGFSNSAHKLAMTTDSFGKSSCSMSSFFNARVPSLVAEGGQPLKNYYSYLGVDLNTFVDKECVIQYNRTSATNADFPSLGAGLKLYMISEVLKQHNVKTGVCSYVRV